MSHLYASLAQRVATSIDEGIYRPGDRLPGVRVVCEREGVSPSTVVAAYRYLEDEGYIEARPRSGFYVRPRLRPVASQPSASAPPDRPVPVNGQELVLQFLQSVNKPGIVQLGANIPHVSFLPARAVSRAMSAVANESASWAGVYEVPPGLPGLRRQIARRMASYNCMVSPDDIVVTGGCQEAIYLALKAVTKPGDVIAIESPTYHGLLQVIDTLGLEALEIPTDPAHGMSMDALKLAVEQWPVKACVVVPNFNNPLGSLMPPAAKAQLLTLAKQHDFVLIEDDIYGDLPFEGLRPGVIKADDADDVVIHCASFSKTLSPGLRTGWLVSGRYRERIEYEKFVLNCATATSSQLAAEKLLARGLYERHLRGMRVALAHNVARMAERVAESFPEGVKITHPQGGMALWIELPGPVDTTRLARDALARGISIAPGAMFSSTPAKYRHCLRLNCALPWDRDVERAVATLGAMATAAID